MANTLGALLVRLGLDAAEFVAGLTKSEYQARKWAQSVEGEAKRVGQAIGIHVSAGVTALFLLTKSAIDNADKLNDLSKSTGIAVETLGGLGLAAKQSGTDLDGVAKAVGKLNIQIAEAAAGGQKAQEGFAAMGISVRDAGGNIKSADKVLLEIADKFKGYDDDANKAALANREFGKTYASIIPLLDEGGAKLQETIDYFKKYGGVNKEVAQQADEFNDTLVKINLLSGAFARNLAAALLPSMQAVANEFVNMKEKGDGFKSGAEDLAEFLKSTAVAALYTATLFREVGTVIGATAAQMNALSRLDFSGYSEIQRAASEDLDKMAARRDKLIDAIRNPPKPTIGATAGSNTPKTPTPGLPGSESSDLAKKLFDQQIKDVERFVKDEQDVFRDREHFLQSYYQDDLVSIRDYFSRREGVLSEWLQNTTAAYDEAIAIARKFAASAAPKDRIDAETKIADLVNKRADVERNAAKASVENFLEQGRAARQFQDSLEQVAIAIANAKGDTVGAGLRSFDQQFKQARQRALTEGVGVNAIDEYRKLTENQLRLTKATQDYQLTLDQLGIDQQRIGNLLEDRSITELESLKLKSDATKSYIAVLRAELETMEAIANASGKREDIVRVAQLKVQLEGLEAQGDLVAKKFTDVFSNSFADALTDAVTGTKSLSDAFKSMEKNIVQSISRIAANNIAEALFGKNGPAGGIGSIFSKIFGGGGDIVSKLFGGSGGADAAKSLTGLDATTATTSASMVELTASATAAATALASVASTSTATSVSSAAGGGGGVGWLGELLGWGKSFAERSSFTPGWTSGFDLPMGSFATGTNFAPGGWAKVHKDEIINLPRGSQVIPANDARNMGGGLTQIINVMPGANRATADQSALMAAREAKRAGRYA